MAATQTQVISKLHQVTPHGRYFRCLCPFHDDASGTQPSLLVYEDGAYCLSELRRFSLDRLWAKLHGEPDVLEVVKPGRKGWRWGTDYEVLAETSHDTLMQSPDLQAELIRRRVADMILPAMLGWRDGWYMIPLRDQDGRVTGMLTRATPDVQKATGERCIPSPGQPRLYSPDWASVESSSCVFVVFGWVDALSIASLGYPVVTPTHGKHARPEWFSGIQKRLLFLPDYHEETAAWQLICRLGWRGRLIKFRYPDGCKDPNDVHVYRKSLLTRTLAKEFKEG